MQSGRILLADSIVRLLWWWGHVFCFWRVAKLEEMHLADVSYQVIAVTRIYHLDPEFWRLVESGEMLMAGTSCPVTVVTTGLITCILNTYSLPVHVKWSTVLFCIWKMICRSNAIFCADHALFVFPLISFVLSVRQPPLGSQQATPSSCHIQTSAWWSWLTAQASHSSAMTSSVPWVGWACWNNHNNNNSSRFCSVASHQQG